MPASPRRQLATLVLVATGALAAAGPASAAPVSAGSLEWNTLNTWESTAPPGSSTLNRTWLGYVTGTGPGQGQGSATPAAPATGPTVTTSTARGPASPAVTWAFPLDGAQTNSFDAATTTGTIEFDGNVRFHFSPGGPSSFDVDLQDPLVVLSGTTGKLYASGSSAGSTPTYDRSQPVFDLDLTGATTATTDRVTSIDGIVASIATAQWPFPSTYAAGAGPERDPDTFGSFDLSVTEAPVLTASKTTDVVPGESVTVTGSRFKTTVGGAGDLDAQGYYVALVGPDFDTSTMGSPTGAVAFVPGATVSPDGGFSRALTLDPTFGTGANAVDCLQVACKLYVWRAHRDADPSQRVSLPITFKAPADLGPGTPDPGPGTPDPGPGTPGPGTGTPTTPPATTPPAAATTPKLTKVTLKPRKLSFRVSEGATVTVTVKRRVVRRVKRKGKTRRVVSYKTVRTLEREVAKAGTYSLNPKLGKGRFRVTLRAVGATGRKSKAVVATARVR